MRKNSKILKNYTIYKPLRKLNGGRKKIAEQKI